MRSLSLILVAILISFFVLPKSADAQSKKSAIGTWSGESRPWEDALDEVKSDIAELVKENDRLQQKYSGLKNQLNSVQDRINQHRLENKEIRTGISTTQRLIEQQEHKRDAIERKIERLKQEITTNQGKAGSLEAELGEYEDRLSLWNMKVKELELQKEELKVELDLQEQLRNEIKEGKTTEIEKLQKQLSDLKGRESDLGNSISDMTDKNRMIMEDIARLREENENMEDKIVELRRSKTEKIKYTKKLRKQDLKFKIDDDEYERKVNEKEQLERKISKMEEQLDVVRQSLEMAATLQEKKRMLIDQIISLDEENHNLRQRVKDLKSNIAALKKEASAAGASY